MEKEFLGKKLGNFFLVNLSEPFKIEKGVILGLSTEEGMPFGYISDEVSKLRITSLGNTIRQ